MFLAERNTIFSLIRYTQLRRLLTGFSQFLTNFFIESDAKFLREYGMNALRIPFNYSHFLREPKQLYPFQINEDGFKHLDRVVNLCADHGIYIIFDLHAVPGGQNTDWHLDSPGHHASFWDLLDYQNWVVDLWKEIARHYKGHPWVAGYNPLNEPTEKTETKLLEFYDRVVKAIREVDPHHLSNRFPMRRLICSFPGREYIRL